MTGLRRLLDLELELPDRGTGARAARHQVERGPSRRWMTGFASLLLLAVVAGGALTYVGVATVRDSTAGRTVAGSTDPSEPGFEAFLEPTPTMLLVHEVDGALTSLALLALGSGDSGGSVLVIPPDTVVESSVYEGPLSVGYAFGGGLDAVFGSIQRLLQIGIAGRVVVDDSRWAELTRGVAPISIDSPDAVEDFPAGPVELAPDDVGEWLRAAEPDESDLGRMYRQQLFWQAWLRQVAAADDPSAVPGEVDSGIGRFVRGLAAGEHRIATLPVVSEERDDGGEVYRLDPQAATSLVSELVPFPRGAWQGARTRVRLLDGTGAPDHALQAAPLLVPAGAAIVIVGNDEAFDQQETEIRYHHPSQRAAAERLRAALGAGRVVEDARQADGFDVTIVLGTDV